MADRKKFFNDSEVAFLCGLATGVFGITASFLVAYWTQ